MTKVFETILKGIILVAVVVCLAVGGLFYASMKQAEARAQFVNERMNHIQEVLKVKVVE